MTNARSIKRVLMSRDGMSSIEADELIDLAKDDMNDRLRVGGLPVDICEEWFGLESDYIDELID